MRRALRNSLLPLIALVAVGAHPGRPTKEDTARRDMERAERARAAEMAVQRAAAVRAATASAEEQHLTEDRVATAARLRDAEEATAAVAGRIDALAVQKRAVQASIAAHAETMQPLLPLIERLSLFPAETLLAVPAAAEDTLRGVLVLRGLTGQVARDAVVLRDEQASLTVTSDALQAEAPRLEAAQARQQAQAAGLDRRIAAAAAQRREAGDEAAAAEQRAATAAARAETLRGMLAALAVQRLTERAQARADASHERAEQVAAAVAARQPQADLEPRAGTGTMASSAQPQRQLTAPVAGTIIRAWGDATDGGPATGISYRAPPAARVVSVCGGRVVFAAPFRSYGLLLIVDCGGGYHSVMAGFDRLDVRVGQSVAAGEPVGVMPGWEPGKSGERPALYVELRHEGQPVNPAPWLRASS